jgi:hypothetical protein
VIPSSWGLSAGWVLLPSLCACVSHTDARQAKATHHIPLHSIPFHSIPFHSIASHLTHLIRMGGSTCVPPFQAGSRSSSRRRRGLLAVVSVSVAETQCKITLQPGNQQWRPHADGICATLVDLYLPAQALQRPVLLSFRDDITLTWTLEQDRLGRRCDSLACALDWFWLMHRRRLLNLNAWLQWPMAQTSFSVELKDQLATPHTCPHLPMWCVVKTQGSIRSNFQLTIKKRKKERKTNKYTQFDLSYTHKKFLLLLQ